MRTGQVAFLAMVAYVPLLLSSPGRVSADSKQALMVEPGQFLARAANMWDPSFGAGTVPHQHIGYLWPMGPWFWFFDLVGIPTWVAQRLWVGTLIFAAALGMRWLARSIGATSATATAVALVYALTPYQLAFTARASVLLLPWVGLPWLVELTRRAVRHSGWRHPMLFGLVVATVAGVNATSLVLVGLGPLGVVVHALASGVGARRVLGAAARIAVVSLGVSAWWLMGLRIQGSHGLSVLHLTENLTDVARWSLPGDVLRGLGNWFFAGRDRLGYSVDQAELYLDNRLMVALTLALPVIALVVAVLARGRVRLFAIACVLLALVVGVGAWPTHQPTWFGRGFAWFVEETSAGLALRNSHRVVPVLVMGVALLLAVGVEQLLRPRLRLVGAFVVGAIAIGTMAPVMINGFLSEHLDRPEEIPAVWREAAAVLNTRAEDGTGNPSRVLEVPGAPFAAHRWGNTVEPILPSMLDRPHVAREVLPYGSEATANLLDAFDRRMQEGIFEPSTLAPLARLFAAGDVVVRSDLAFERFRTPEPSALWQVLSLSTPGVEGVDAIGAPTVNEPDPRLAPIDERHLHFESLVGTTTPRVGAPVPPVGILTIDQAPSVLQAVTTGQAVVLAGDGDGIVDAAAAGLIDGQVPVLYIDALDDAALDRMVDDGASLILTDSNRRRIQTWFYALRDTRGPTERPGETLGEPSGYDHRIEAVAGLDDASRSVIDQGGAEVTATASAGAARPEDRAAAAIDGDLATSWRVGGADPRGHRLMIQLEAPLDLDRITITQPIDGPRDRVLETVAMHTDGHPSVEVTLGPESLTPEGQVVRFSSRTVNRLEIEITGVSMPSFDPALANAVGIAELGIADLVVVERLVMPPSMLARLGDRSLDLGLDLVMTRLRYDPYDRGRVDPERRLHRSVLIPGQRAFRLSGLARINPTAPDDQLDLLLGTVAESSVSASSRLEGDLSARARSAVDGRSDTAWTAAFGEQVGQWIEIDQPAVVTSLEVGVVVDELHSTPTVLRVEVDGRVVMHHHLDLADAGPPGTVQIERIELPSSEEGAVRLVVEEVRRRSAPPGEPAVMATLPVAINEIIVNGQGNPEQLGAGYIDSGCRRDILTINGEDTLVRIHGAVDDARTGLSVEACVGAPHAVVATPAGDLPEAPGLGLGGGVVVSSAAGHLTGIDIDRLVLSSGPDGEAREPAVRGRVDRGAARIVEVDAGATRWQASVATDGEPFWLVLGQSVNRGWELRVDDAEVGAQTLINGYANGWEIFPASAGELSLDLEWAPQRQVFSAMAASVFALALAVGFVIGGRQLPVPAATAVAEPVPTNGRPTTMSTVLVSAAVVGVLLALISPPWMGVVAAGVVVARATMPLTMWAWAGAVPAIVAACLVLERPNLAWLAVGVAVAAVVGAEAADGWTGLRRCSPQGETPVRARGFRAPHPNGPGSGGPRDPDPET